MFDPVYCGFDTLTVAFRGALSAPTIEALKEAQSDARQRLEPVLARVGPYASELHVREHGKKGGYAFSCNTGPLGLDLWFKENEDPYQWNILVSAGSLTLATYGYTNAKSLIFETLRSLDCVVGEPSINRADFAVDFSTQGFEPRLERFVTPRSVKRGYWDQASRSPSTQFAAFNGAALSTVTIGKLPGLEVTMYDKRREVLQRRKPYWFEVWKIDPECLSTQVWRVEIRCGKRELRRWNMRTFFDFECYVGDVLVDAAKRIRYVADGQTDTNISRQTLHPIWKRLQETLPTAVHEFRSGLSAERAKQLIRSEALASYRAQLLGLIAGYAVVLGIEDADIGVLPGHVSKLVHSEIETKRLAKKVAKARERLRFIA